MTDNNEEKPKRRRKHSPETIAKMSERRRARTVQPRSGTSKKRQNLYQELLHEYKDFSGKEKDELLKWIEENKRDLNISAEQTKELGIHCEYHTQYPGIYEIGIGSVLYGNKLEESYEEDPFEL